MLKNLTILESIYLWLKKFVIPKFMSCSAIIMYCVWYNFFLPYVWDISNWLWCLVLSTLIGDSQNQSYLNLGTSIPFKLKVRSYISSMYFSWKYGLRMWQHGFRKMSFQTLKTWIKKMIRILSIFSCHSSSSHSQPKNNCI